MRFVKMVLALGLLAVAATCAQAQTPEERYFNDRAAAIARFTPERVPSVEKPQMDEEERARLALDKQLFAIVGKVGPKGFGAAKSNVTTLFTGDIDFGKLDALVFEADQGRTQMLVTTLPLMRLWLKGVDELPKDPDQAIRNTSFFTNSVSTDAAILNFGTIPLDSPATFAMLAGRTQDRSPDEANEVFVAAIRGDRVFVAYSALKQAIKAPPCTKARGASDRRIEILEKKESKPGEDNADLSERMSKMRDAADAEFLRCFAEQAPKTPPYAAAVARARELLDRMPTK